MTALALERARLDLHVCPRRGGGRIPLCCVVLWRYNLPQDARSGTQGLEEGVAEACAFSQSTTSSLADVGSTVGASGCAYLFAC